MTSPPPQYEKDIYSTIQNALQEDIGDGDVTSNAIFSDDATCSGKFIARSAGVIAGIEVARHTFSTLDKHVQFQPDIKDGEEVKSGTVIARLSGPCKAILSGERTALNFLQRMSGIATLTRKFVRAALTVKTNVTILDTRKTAPGLRAIDKWAVNLGGGKNHRHGLYDMVLIKENHIKAAGSIRSAVERVRQKVKQNMLIEVEVKNLKELGETFELKVDWIMLDNMSIDDMREAVRITDHRIPLEASGNVTLENVAEIAATGVDFISVGKLTHSAQALDITLLLNEDSR